MPQNIFEKEPTPIERPVFLKVLCILTFIGSGYGLINSSIAYWKANDIANLFTQGKTEIRTDMNRKKRDTAAISLVNNIMKNMDTIATPQNLRRSATGTFISSVICLLGAVLMWRLRKAGFYIYTAGTLTGIALPLFLFGSNFITNMSAAFLGFIGILFVIFYAMNLKSMK